MDTLYDSQLADGELQDAINSIMQRMEQLDFLTQHRLLESYRAVLDDLMSMQSPAEVQDSVL